MKKEFLICNHNCNSGKASPEKIAKADENGYFTLA